MSSVCTYTQDFVVIPLIGGITSFDPDFSKCVFDYIVYDPSLRLEVDGDWIKATVGDISSPKSKSFYQSVIIFRDDFPLSNVGECVRTVHYVENTPLVQVGDSRLYLSIGSAFSIQSGDLVPVQIPLNSVFNKNAISRDLFDAIKSKEIIESSSDQSKTGHPIRSMISEIKIVVLGDATKVTTFELLSTQPIYTFDSWYVADLDFATRYDPLPGTINQFTADDNTTYNIGYEFTDQSGNKAVLYAQVAFPVTLNNPTYYLFSPTDILYL